MRSAKRIFSVTIASALFAVMVVGEPVKPSAGPTPPWELDVAAWPKLEPVLAKLVPGHTERWRKYADLEMTPVDESDSFEQELASAMRQQMVGLPEAPDKSWADWQAPQPKPLLREGPAFLPQGPLDEASFRMLVRGVRDVLLFQQSKPFAEQRKRFFANRSPSIPFPDLFTSLVREQWNETIDPRALSEEQRWDYVRRLYEARYQGAGKDVEVVGAALNGPAALCGAVWVQDMQNDDMDWLCWLLFKRDTHRYWRGGLTHCGLPITTPEPSADSVKQRNGQLLHAQLHIVLELRNGDRAPISIMAFYDPATRRWGFESASMMSSPFEASIIATR